MVDLLALLAGITAGALAAMLAVLGLRRAPVPVPARSAAPSQAPPPPPAPSAPAPAPAQPVVGVSAPVPLPSSVPDATAVYGAHPTSVRPSAAHLEPEDGSAGVDLGDEPVTLGRGSDQALRIRDNHASRAHAVVRPRRTGGWELVDNGSANGTKLNGHRIPKGKVAPLRDGDRIGIGAVTIVYRERGGGPTAPAGQDDDPTRIA